MRFFAQQSVKRWQSIALLSLFVLALLGMAVLIHIVCAGFSVLFGDSERFSELSLPALVLTGLVWSAVFLGAFFRALDVRSGGAMLARRFGAVRASDRSRFLKEKLLINVVAEISIASATQQPEVYILRNESSINAFVLGTQADDEDARRYAIVVTQGALDTFDRSQLQAIVAHEFGHIANGDLPLNMQLLIILGGLMAIDEVGRILVGKDPKNTLHPGVFVGYTFRALGSVGVFCGQILRAAFSRQREYLADASAIQFTRNPSALASALVEIKAQHHEPALHSAHAQELAHLCFQSSEGNRWFRRLLATHPSLQSRVDAIDPHFSLKQRKAKRPRKEVHYTQDMRHGTSAINGTVNADIGRALPDRVIFLLADDTSCLAALLAMFVSDDSARQGALLSAIAFGFNGEFAKRVKQMVSAIPDELSTNRLGLVDHATTVLKKNLQAGTRQQFLVKLERILVAADELGLMNYASLQLLRQKLDVEFPLLETLSTEAVAQGRHAKAFDSMGSEFALLLSLVVESSGTSQAVQNEEFNRVLKCYTQTRYPRRTANETGIVEELEFAFQTLYVQPKSIREAFVQHCIEIVERDGYKTGAESALIGLFAASLGCEQLAA